MLQLTELIFAHDSVLVSIKNLLFVIKLKNFVHKIRKFDGIAKQN